ncbi:hypothetical protein AALC17_19505 [Oscillospiraceae bacterium 38-13]
MEVYLSRNHQTCLHLLPLSVGRFQGVFDQPNGPDGRSPRLVIERFISPIECLERHLKGLSLRSMADVSQLNELVEMVERMAERDRQILSGALRTEHVKCLADVYRTVQNISDYELIGGVTTDRALGQWLVKAGRLNIKFPENVQPYLDYDVIGSVYHDAHGGAFTPDGYVQRKKDIPKPERDTVICLTLATAEQSDTLLLPASEKQIEDAERTLGDLDRAVIADVEFKLPYLKHLIPTDHVTVEEAQALADCLQGMAEEEEALLTYCSALAVEEPTSFTEALNIAMNICEYKRVPEDLAEYAELNLRLAGAGDEILGMLAGFTDFRKLGEAIAKQEGVRQTIYGSVCRLSDPFPAEDIGQTMY